MQALLHSPFLVLFAVIAVGSAVGAVRVRQIGLGSAGVFFAALLAGHLIRGVAAPPPHELTEFGLVLFVYAVGLSAGPRFFASMRRSGPAYLAVGAGATLTGAAACVALALALSLPGDLAAGLYCGATTCTPALAAVLDTLRRGAEAAAGASGAPSAQAPGAEAAAAALVAYGAAYPFTVAAVVLTVQLLPRLLRTTAAAAAEQFRQREAEDAPPIERCAFRIINPNCAGRTIGEIQSLHVSRAVISRVRQGGEVHDAGPQRVLHLGDVVLAVGAPNELAKLEALLGEVVVDDMQDQRGRISSEQILVSQADAIGKTLRELALWERHGVVVTRVRRESTELSPRGALVIEPGDVLRVVGPPEGLSAAAAAVGREERRLNETSMASFALGVALGAALGLVPLLTTGGVVLRLGVGGGAFLVGLLLGQVGTRGPVRLYVPNAAKHFARELGLVVFLAGAGLAAGARFADVIAQSGVALLLAGGAVTLVTIASAVLLMFAVLRWNLLFGAGALAATMTNPPGLSAANSLSDADASALGFASVYPFGLLAKIVLAPLVLAAVEMMRQ